MDRRFFDSSIWSSVAFRKLKPSLKTLYFYVWSKCDACGCYVVDMDYIKIDTGEKYSISDFEKLSEFSLKKISSGKFFFENFINVNYGTLKENYNPHKPAFRSLLKNNIIYNSSLNQACFKLEEEEYEGEDKGEEEGKEEHSDFEILEQFPFEEFWNSYDKKTERPACEKKFAKLSEKEKELIWAHVPKYVASTPDKKYRKNPDTYLNNKCWNDEIIKTSNNGTGSKQGGSLSEQFDRQFFGNG